MRSELPKVLHPVCGRPMLSWPIAAAREAGAGRIAVIVSPDRDLSPALPAGVETIVQPEADGTGGALRAASSVIDGAGTVVVLSGDHPLDVRGADRGVARDPPRRRGRGDRDDRRAREPGSYGRIVRDESGDVERIVEAKQPTDATPEELAIREINTGTYAFEPARWPTL